VDRDLPQASICTETYVRARCAGPLHVSPENFKFSTGSFVIADSARPSVGFQNICHGLKSGENHLFPFTSITFLELLAFGQILISLFLSSVRASIKCIRRLFKRCLDVLFHVSS
jgi:hypothetical protein